MKTMKRILSVLSLLLLVTAPALAQTATTQTTLSGAITSNQTTFTVASATGISAGSQLFFADSNEAVLVASISGTTVTANQRGVDGTSASAHPTGVIIFASPGGSPSPSSASPFIHGAPIKAPAGNTCVRASQQVLPLIDVDSGNIWDCTSDITSVSTINGNPSNLGTNTAASNLARWKGSNINVFDQSSLPRVSVVNVAYQIKPWDFLISITSISGGGFVLTLPPATGLIGKQFIIVDESGSVANGTAATVVGTINGAANLALNSAYTSIRLFCNGVSYFKIW